MEFKLSQQDIWLSTLLFGGLGIIALVTLILMFQNELFGRRWTPFALISALFWGLLATVAIFGFWELYYQYIYPHWARWLAPADALLYGLIGFGMWQLSTRLSGSAVLWFAFIGGLEGVIEHLVGIYALRILEKVSWLQGISPLSVVVFSFFEYVLYWTLIAWLAFLVLKIRH